MDHHATRLYPTSVDSPDVVPEIQQNRTLAAAALKRKDRRHVCVVLSDDLAWCRKSIRYRDDVLFIKSGDDYLAVHSICRGSIITGGSHGWWAAWLNGGHTVTSVDLLPMLRCYSKEDYVPPSFANVRRQLQF